MRAGPSFSPDMWMLIPHAHYNCMVLVNFTSVVP
jgi:hypothetical protein